MTVVDRLKVFRGRGESYSDVILRLAERPKRKGS
jgi:predicted CopG family antitoxin